MDQIRDQSGPAVIMTDPRDARLTERVMGIGQTGDAIETTVPVERTLTSDCAQGTAFGDLMEAVEGIKLPVAELRTSWLDRMTRTINVIFDQDIAAVDDEQARHARKGAGNDE